MITLDTLELPEELIWVDEFNYSEVQAKKNITIQGKVIIEESTIKEGKGRPITLTGDNAWIKRPLLKTLYGYAQETEKSMTLTLNDTRTFQVKFRFWEPPVVEAQTIWQNAFADDESEYFLTLKLVTA